MKRMERTTYLNGLVNCMRSRIIRSTPIHESDIAILEEILEGEPDKDCFIVDSYNIKGHRLVYLEPPKKR